MARGTFTFEILHLKLTVGVSAVETICDLEIFFFFLIETTFDAFCLYCVDVTLS